MAIRPLRGQSLYIKLEEILKAQSRTYLSTT
jgi:hypothetical protein